MAKFDSAVVEGDKITLDRAELEELRDHYCKCADKYKPKRKDKVPDFHYGFYLGKADVCVEMLQCFDDLII